MPSWFSNIGGRKNSLRGWVDKQSWRWANEDHHSVVTGAYIITYQDSSHRIKSNEDNIQCNPGSV